MFEQLFSQIDIGQCRVDNRLVVPAMVMNYCREDGYPTERYFAYHEAKARGGWGLIITQDYAVVPRGKGYTHIPGFWEDGQVEPHAELPRRVHRHGAKVFAQIYHAGRQSNSAIMGQSPVAPSPIPCPTKKQMPHPLSVEEIAEIVEQFGDAAVRAKQAGFDGIEIHGAHGYLIAQFMSAYSNKRTDLYGGSVRNRARFALEIMANIRKKVGDDFPVLFRISGDEFVAGGRTIEETKALCLLLEEAGVDGFHISAGVYGSRHRVVPPARMPHGHVVHHAADVRSAVSVPVITVGWINDPFMAESIVVSGKADMVAMGRASLADPEMPVKVQRGQFDDIIYCIGCMQGCAEKIRKQGEPGGCMINPETGREFELVVSPAERSKKIAVAGGGIAGLEAAIFAARRGHQVHVFERSDSLGGEFRFAAVGPGKGDMSSFISWQQNQLKKLGVTVHLESEFTTESATEIGAEAVIVATGSEPLLPEIPGLSRENVIYASDVLAGKVDVGQSVVIIGGGMVGCETANHLASHEKQVTIIEEERDIAVEEESNSRGLLLRDLEGFEVQIFNEAAVKGIADHTVVVYADGKETTLTADSIIVATGSRPRKNLESELRSLGLPVSVVGDAAEVRNALSAIEEGFQAGLSA